MLDFKSAYDAVNSADAALKAKASEIAALLDQGTDEATNQALALQESLDTLQADYNKKLGLYQSLVKANAPSDVASLFVPASSTEPDANAKSEKPKDVMSLSEYNAMPPQDRLAFAKRGGKLQ